MTDDKRKQNSDFLGEDEGGMEKNREAGQQGGETVAEEGVSEYYSDIEPLRDRSQEDEGRRQTPQENMEEEEGI